MLELRPHHLLCTQGYSGKGYNEEFVENMNGVVDKLRNVLGFRVKIVCGSDNLCNHCPNMLGENLCATQDKVAGFDRKTMEVFGIEEKEYVYSEVVDYIRSVATQENMSYICSECSWYPISACRRNILNKE